MPLQPPVTRRRIVRRSGSDGPSLFVECHERLTPAGRPQEDQKRHASDRRAGHRLRGRPVAQPKGSRTSARSTRAGCDSPARRRGVVISEVFVLLSTAVERRLLALVDVQFTERITPLLVCEDIEAAHDFLVSAFGLRAGRIDRGTTKVESFTARSTSATATSSGCTAPPPSTVSRHHAPWTLLPAALSSTSMTLMNTASTPWGCRRQHRSSARRPALRPTGVRGARPRGPPVVVWNAAPLTAAELQSPSTAACRLRSGSRQQIITDGATDEASANQPWVLAVIATPAQLEGLSRSSCSVIE